MVVLIPAAALVGALGWRTYRQARQARLDNELVAAVVADNPVGAADLLKQGADPNYWPQAKRRPGWRGWLDRLGAGPRWPGGPMLILATVKGRYRTVPVLLRYGANPNTRGYDGATPLGRELASAGDPTTVRWLLDYGADPNAADAAGVTPLMRAARKCEIESIRLLLERGAEPQAVSRDGSTALADAVKSCPPVALALLLNRDADPNVQDSFGMTPLAWAAFRDSEAHVALLLDGGADPTLRNARGVSPAGLTSDPVLRRRLRRAEAEWQRRRRRTATPPRPR